MWRRFLKKVVTPPLYLVAIMVLFFETTFWEWMMAFSAWLARVIPVFVMVERLVERLSPRWVFGIFIIPLLGLIPSKLVALYLVTHGHIIQGMVFIITLKIVGTAISARLFSIAKPKLLLVPTFAKLYHLVIRYSQLAHAWLNEQSWWQEGHIFMARIRKSFSMKRGNRFRAIMAVISRMGQETS